MLNVAAADMLKVFLRKWRAKRRDEVRDRRVNEVRLALAVCVLGAQTSC